MNGDAGGDSGRHVRADPNEDSCDSASCDKERKSAYCEMDVNEYYEIRRLVNDAQEGIRDGNDLEAFIKLQKIEVELDDIQGTETTPNKTDPGQEQP